jgi:peptide/nickel transport system substrate-binding protein
MRVAAAVALAMLATCLAACGSSLHTATVITSIPGRTFTDLVPQLPDDLDATGTPDPSSSALLPTWSGELVRPAGAKPGPNAVLPGDDAVTPYLATSWYMEHNGDYVFTLRRGVRAPSGDALSAQDVRWSLERAVARVAEVPFLFNLANIDQSNPVTILSADRVRINVSAPSPFTLSVLASPDAAIYDSRLYRAHATATDPWAVLWASSYPASYAAYFVSNFVPNKQIVLTANPGFWRRPYYTHVVIMQVPDSEIRLDDVLAGIGSHTSGLDWGDFAQAVAVGASNGVQAGILQNGPGVYTWQLNVARGPLANALVRQAISLGISRTQLASDLAGGNSTASTLAVPPTFGQSQPTPFDPALARSLISSAGYPLHLTIDVYTNGTVGTYEVGTLLYDLYKHSLSEIGVVPQPVRLENTDQLLALELRRGVESTVEVNAPLLGGPGFLLEQDYNAQLDPLSEAARENYSNGALQRTLNELRTTPPGATADALVRRATTLADNGRSTINLATVPVQNVTRSDITGYAAYTQPVTYYEYLHPGS